MDKKTKGAWLVHHTNKLTSIVDTGKYGNIRFAGKSGILLSALTTDKEVSLTKDKVNALSQASGVDTTFELKPILEKLAERHLIEKHHHGIEVLGLTTSTVLQHTCDIFHSLDASLPENASLELAELCSISPREAKEIKKYLSDTFTLGSSETSVLVEDAKEIGFTDYESIDAKSELFFNGNLFRREELEKISIVLNSLQLRERLLITEVDELLRKSGCIPYAEIEKILGKDLFKKLKSIGMYDVNVVSNPKEQVAYITRPSAFIKYGNAAVSDAFDLAKAMVASLSYGIHRSHPGRGRIVMVDDLVKKLIRGLSVGPATAIGEDYKVLELKHVVAVRRQDYAFSMRLLKKEVGELSLQVIKEGDASEQSLSNLPGAAITKYQSPEEHRQTLRRRMKKVGDKELISLIQNLRTGRL